MSKERRQETGGRRLRWENAFAGQAFLPALTVGGQIRKGSPLKMSVCLSSRLTVDFFRASGSISCIHIDFKQRFCTITHCSSWTKYLLPVSSTQHPDQKHRVPFSENEQCLKINATIVQYELNTTTILNHLSGGSGAGISISAPAGKNILTNSLLKKKRRSLNDTILKNTKRQPRSFIKIDLTAVSHPSS